MKCSKEADTQDAWEYLATNQTTVRSMAVFILKTMTGV
jgi:hypothetical protein